jgi:hypothetical protein
MTLTTRIVEKWIQPFLNKIEKTSLCSNESTFRYRVTVGRMFYIKKSPAESELTQCPGDINTRTWPSRLGESKTRQ